MSKVGAARVALKVGLEALGATADVAALASVFGLDAILGLKQDDGLDQINGKLDQINGKLDSVIGLSKDILDSVDQLRWDNIKTTLSSFNSELKISLQDMLYYHIASSMQDDYFKLAMNKSHDTLVKIIDYIGSVDADPSVVAPILLSAIAVREEVIWELGDGAFSYDYKGELINALTALENLKPTLDKICLDSVDISWHQQIPSFGLNFSTKVQVEISIHSSDFYPEYQIIQYDLSLGDIGPADIEYVVQKFNTDHNKDAFMQFFKDHLYAGANTYFTEKLSSAFAIFDSSVAFPEYGATYANLKTLTSGQHLAGDNGNTQTINDVLTAPAAEQIWDDSLKKFVDPAGAKYAVLDGYRGDDVLTGNEVTNLLRGGEGDDKLYGYPTDHIWLGGITNVAGDILLGGAGNDVLYAGYGNDRLDGGEGIDTISFEYHDDAGVYVSLDTIGPQNQGYNSYTILNVENIVGSPTDDFLIGSNSDNVLSGGDGNDTLKGLAGNDTLDGGRGYNTLEGGLGNDTYFDLRYSFRNFNQASTLIENAGGGNDTVLTNADGYVLDSNFENLTMLGAEYADLTMDMSGTGNELANVITGNTGNNHLSGMAGNDTLVGGDGNDTLDGGTGADQMTGGAGDDTYLVDSAGDTAVELAAGGTDTVMAAISYAIGDFVEVLTLTGSDNLDGTGNALDNTINGNAGNNKLIGGSGNDTLYGGDGNDTLDGSKGADKLFGGSGNDRYNVNSSSDRVYETATATDTTDLGGTDTVVSSINFTLGQYVENLTLSGKANLAGTGNDLANTLVGNKGANILMGLAGNDTLRGGAGNDKLYGGAGKDTLTGGSGKDLFIFNTAPTSRDTITDFSHAESDKIQLSKAVFKGFAYTGALHADDFYAAAGATKAHDATDRLIYNTTTGILYYDADGKDGAAAVEVALFGASTHANLVYGDLQIIA